MFSYFFFKSGSGIRDPLLFANIQLPGCFVQNDINVTREIISISIRAFRYRYVNRLFSSSYFLIIKYRQSIEGL
jgi:hypothetical protein